MDAACAAAVFPALKHKVLIDGGAAGWTDLGEMTADAPLRLEPGSYETTSAEDPFMIYFTSGTTKYPKMVLHRCSYPLGHLRTALLWHDIKPHDLIWVLSDTGWAKAAWGMYGQWIAGAAIFVHNAEGKFLPRLTMKLLTSQGVTIFCAPPTVYRMLNAADTVGLFQVESRAQMAENTVQHLFRFEVARVCAQDMLQLRLSFLELIVVDQILGHSDLELVHFRILCQLKACQRLLIGFMQFQHMLIDPASPREVRKQGRLHPLPEERAGRHIFASSATGSS